MNTSILNTSCFDATDSVWINVMDPELDVLLEFVYTGCIDGPAVDLPNWAKYNHVGYHVETKKNGVLLDLGYLNFDLLHEQVNEVTIEI